MIDTREDFHVHSTFSDDAVSTLAENLAAAADRGLSTIRLVEHVRASTEWVPDLVAALAALAVPSGLRVLSGVEAKILDTSGALDVPAELTGVDAVVIADHQFPTPDGPCSPDGMLRRLADGLAVAEALDMLIEATVAAMAQVPAGQLAHSFSILPKVGLDEDALSDAQLRHWAAAAGHTRTLVEVNEKWACPGPRAIAAAAAAGCSLVAGTDSHRAHDVGRYATVHRLVAEALA